ncbi:MAG: glucosyl-3-phosphoglycerate synthase [Chloroflexi bacterium]|nr:glucosyl-3-phosphoglycerate synthase [Chloroflexota bacterium]
MPKRVGPVIVMSTSRTEAANLLRLARPLARARRCEVRVVGMVRVDADETLSAGARPAQRLRKQLETLVAPDEPPRVHVTHDPWREIRHIVRRERASLLLANWSSAIPASFLNETPCDLGFLRGRLPAKVRRILLPVRGGRYAGLALGLALAVAQAHAAGITLLHAERATHSPRHPYQQFLDHLHGLDEITRRVQMRGDAARAITREARTLPYQLLVMGAVARPQAGEPPAGQMVTRVLQRSETPTLIVKTHRAFTPAADATAEPVDYTISVLVDKWFAENTFDAAEFADIAQLVELKERQGLTISLGLPALNEAKTVGHVIQTVQTLMHPHRLLDEIVLIDSNSTDKTVEIAQQLGVPVYRHPEILPRLGAYTGKGEALWKSLHVLKGDLIAWIDTDIVNINPRFVYGILGPLIRHPHLMYIKGFYHRPLRVGGRLEARGGGRVTELVARPLLNLFYPELSGIVQPLAGEYAGRRAALAGVPFFTGYGVETGLLIDILQRHGLHAIGQVDLEERIHGNQSLRALSQMAFAIIQVIMQRVSDSRQIALLDAMNTSLKLIRHEQQRMRLEIQEIRDHERPPISSIEEYRKQHER